MNKCKLAMTFLLMACGQGICQTSFWQPATTPGTPEENDTASVNLGVTFYSDVPGSITGIRFYRGPDNSGTHIGNIWSSTGTKLAEVTFSGETASGWQQANFSSPISITANTTYVISYLAPQGYYADDQYYPWSTLSAAPLHVSGSSPGVYAYGTGTIFPSLSWASSNYWVDPVFVAASQSTSSTPPGSSSQDTIWAGSTVPTTPTTSDTGSVTLGLKFYSDAAGSVTGVRFYKGQGNTGTHVGSLWSNTGSKLAEATFSAETTSGWQQANFTSPVSIAANTTYVISYLAPQGHYPCDQLYSWSSLATSPLHVSGSAPGVFAYGSSTVFPNGSWQGSNYWVDLAFVPDSSTSTSPPPSISYSISGHVNGSATVTLSGAASRSTTADATGNYTFSGLANGSYIVTPSQSGYAFTPTSAPVTINGNSVVGVSFTATTVSVSVSHSVTLSWSPSLSSNVAGYNIYRATTSGGSYAKVNGSLVGATTYLDSNVAAGQTYYYVATAVDSSNNESGYSTQATAVVPTP